jgi:hypothetical protein
MLRRDGHGFRPEVKKVFGDEYWTASSISTYIGFEVFARVVKVRWEPFPGTVQPKVEVISTLSV